MQVSRQGFYQYLANQDRPWKYQPLADAMMEILAQDECKDTYGRVRMYQALSLKHHDNACCESIWARMKSELLYGRYDTEKMTIDELKTVIWRYFLSYWNNRRICSANGGLPPVVKRQQY